MSESDPGLADVLPPVPEVAPSLADLGAAGMAVLAWIGAVVAIPVPMTLVLGMVGVAVAARLPTLLLVAALIGGSAFGARAVSGLRPVEPGEYSGTVTLLSDPVSGPGVTRADVRVGRKRLELRATTAGRGALAMALAGEQIAVTGRVRPPPAEAPWLIPRHVVGLLDVASVEPAGAGSVLPRIANRLRRSLTRGAASMSPDDRSLFTGFVLGDDRDQSAILRDDFRGSGLTHLLAVSGENVAFVLALAGPGLRRLRLAPRWVVTLGLIGFFALLTRFEPSVIRASAVAALAATAFTFGRPSSGMRLLSLAVTALVLVDPLLTRSVGFQLSVAASAGILGLSPMLRRALPGPALLADPLAVTAGAQLAVAPLLITVFGGLPVASLPANLLAGPAAGLVMMWGLGAGLVAGVVGEPFAAVLHWPTVLGIRWIAAVARVGSLAPLGELSTPHLAVIVGAMGAGSVGIWHRSGAALRGRRRRIPRWTSVAVALVLMAPAVGLRSPPGGEVAVEGGRLWRGGGATVLEVAGVRSLESLLEDLRRAGVRRLDLVVMLGKARSANATLAALAHRWRPGVVWAAAGSGVSRQVTPALGQPMLLGGLRIEATRVKPNLVVHVSSDPP